MINKIVAVQGNHPSKLNPLTDTSVFLANEIQIKKYKIFYYDPKDLSVVNSKVIAKGFFKKAKVLNKIKLLLTVCVGTGCVPWFNNIANITNIANISNIKTIDL